MEFRDEADKRDNEAELRVHDLQVQLGQVSDDLNFYKHQYQTLGTNKLKSSPGMSSPIGKKIDFDLDPATREPQSPLQYTCSDSRMHKK
ncbi:hypothetical protein Dsin_002837 [Dipteronia sinensis]|uniref:Uncharacterized protein n=1 Tax=Dipteronia sinensis TaxID=43782 RepID=A0AAE0B6Y0_9ROSI|nr:hypothetical protein Dsin_002837 [Dipteronia sinensis]